MNKFLLYLLFSFLFFFISCKKESSPSEETPKDQNTPTTFEFRSLSSASDTIVKSIYTQVTALAFGDSLTYEWLSPFGTIIGSGSTIDFTVCHAGKFSVECTVKDKYQHEQKKSITIIVTD